MPLSDVPALLSKTALTPVVRQLDDDAYHSFAIQPLFGPEVVYSEGDLEYDTQQLMRRLPAWHASPSTADVGADFQHGKKRVSPLYQAERFDVTSRDLNYLRMPGESADLPLSVGDLRSKAERHIAERLRAKVLKFRRNTELLCADVLSTGAPTVTVDGDTTQIINYGVTTQTASASWATAATNVLEELEGWVDDFIELSGGMPTHIVVSHRFWSSYIAVNDDLRDFFIRNFGLGREQILMGPGGFTRPGGAAVQFVQVTDRYLNGSDTVTQIWPTERMTFLRLDSPSVLEMATVRNYDNDLNGGLFSFSKMHDEPPKFLSVFVTDNRIPIIRDPNKVTIHDLVP